MDDFRNTMPVLPKRMTGPVEITPKQGAEIIRASAADWPARRPHAGCTGGCNQGRLPCQAPDACLRPANDGPWPMWHGISVYGVATLVLFAVSGAAIGSVVYVGWRIARAFL